MNTNIQPNNIYNKGLQIHNGTVTFTVKRNYTRKRIDTKAYLAYLPNLLTSLRIALSPFFLLIINAENNIFSLSVVLAIFVAASITDFFDGYLARKLNVISSLGKILDPIADKVMVGFALITFVKLGLIFWWVAAIILVREFGITIHRLYLLKQGVVKAAAESGKLKTGIQITMIIALLLWLLFSAINNQYSAYPILGYIINSLYWISQITIWSSLALTLYSGTQYVLSLNRKNT